MSEPELITVRQASDLTGKSPQYINRLISEGSLQWVTDQGKRKISLARVKELWPDVLTEKAPTAKDMIALKEGFQQALKKRDDKIDRAIMVAFDCKDAIEEMKEVIEELKKAAIQQMEYTNTLLGEIQDLRETLNARNNQDD